jgi:methionyl-tRNA synthetase
LVNKFGNTFSRVVGMAKKYGVENPDFSLDYGGRHNPHIYPSKYEGKITDIAEYKLRMKDYNIYEAIHIIIGMVFSIGQEIEFWKPWEIYKNGDARENG